MSTESNTPASFTPDSLAALASLTRAATPAGRDDGVMPLDPATLSRYLARDFRDQLRRAEQAIADALPALTEADFRAACNGDHAIREEVTAWRDRRWNLVDVSELRGSGDDDGEHPTDWEILRGSSRFEVREVPRYEARRTGGAGEVAAWLVWDNEGNEEPDVSEAITDLSLNEASEYGLNEEQARAVAAHVNAQESERYATVYIVVDTNDRDASTSTGYADARDGDRYGPFTDHDGYDATDEGEAEQAAEAGNRDDYQANACGWPFAWNTAAAIDVRDADDFAAAGFVVAEHVPSGQVYAGIDGGGYDFLEAHWSRVYLRFLLHGTYSQPVIYVPTADGLRRVVRS